MDDWELAVVIVVPTVCLAILAAAIGYTNHRVQGNVDSDVESQRREQSNVDGDVESQRRASSHDEPETRTVNGNLTQVTVIDEEKIASGSAIGVQLDKGRSLITIINEERVHPNFGTEIIMGKGNLSQAIHIDKERVQHNFQSGTTIGQDNVSSFPSINEPKTNINESKIRFIEQRAEKRLENLNIRLEVKPAWESVSPSRSQQEKVHSNINSTNVQNQAQTKATQKQAQTKASQRPAVTHDTRYVRNFTNSQRSNFDTSTGYPQLDLHYYRLKDAMAEFKNFLQESITDYRLSNYSRNKRFILVITGRGKHSPGGIPVIKPAVENYLNVHDYTYNWSNPGLVRIDLLSLREWDDSD